MIIDHHILNKSKKQTIIFLHGMFATGGFWLPYIKNFKSFRLVILTVDYLNLINNSQSDIEKVLQNLFVKVNPIDKCIWICHSLGCSFFKVFIELPATRSFQICPVMLGERRKSENFAADVASILDKPVSIVEEEAEKIHHYMNSHLLIKGPLFFNNSEILVPSNDQYFTYPSNSLSYTQFKGDHYDIQNAINFIKKSIL